MCANFIISKVINNVFAVSAKLEMKTQTHSGTQLVDYVGNIEPRMEINVSRAIWLASAQATGKHIKLAFDLACFIIIHELTN